MKLGKVTKYRFKDGVPTRLMITLVGTINCWIGGKKVTRKISITRHLRLIPFSKNRTYMGREILNDDLVAFGQLNEIGDFELTLFKKKEVRPSKKVEQELVVVPVI